MRIAIPLTVLATALVCSLTSAPAHARARVFVASYGNDANSCTFGSPCKTFQHAHDVVDTGGEVTAIDSAGFGPITINKAVTITSPAGVEAGIVPVSGGDAIDINAGSTDAIVLRGLTLNGSGVGHNGIVFNSGGSITVTDCVAQNFLYAGTLTTGNGILMQPTSGAISFIISNTIVSNNGNSGFQYMPQSGTATANGVVDRLVATNNAFGILIYTAMGGGSTEVAVSNDIASSNSNDGIHLVNGPSPLSISIDNTGVSSNVNHGIIASNTSNVILGRSVITSNGFGVLDSTTGHTFYTYKDNRINLNGTDLSGALNTSFLTQ
jgi:hypothetical protein